MKYSIWQDGDGHFSMMRFGVFVAVVLAAVVIVVAMVGWFLGFKDASTIIGAGTGLLVLALGAKGWQAQTENQSSPPSAGPPAGL